MTDSAQGKSPRNIIITGASGNLGNAVCQRFLAFGDNVFAVAGKNKPVCDPQFVERFFPLQADLSSESATKSLFDNSFAALDHIHSAIFLVGGFAPGKLGTVTGSELKAMFQLNFESAFFLSQLIYTRMTIQKKGNLCFMGARPAVEPGTGTGMAAYTLSKSLVVRLSELYSEAGRKSGINSAAFIPSVIDTPENRKAMPDVDYTRWVTPYLIADTLLFYCSDSASAIRGGTFKIYGDA